MQNGVRTNHDRHAKPAGASSVSLMPSRPAPPLTNGGAVPIHPPRPPKSTDPTRMNSLPDEIEHVRNGFIPIRLLLSRLAQRTHNELRDAIVEMARIPVAKQIPNGNSAPSYSPRIPNDDSKENLQKKRIILDYAQKQHENWVKALIITNWSRNADDLSKLIDVVQHMYKQHNAYMAVRDTLIENKESFTFARVPSPDLKTALQVLSQGTFPALPDYGFIDPPPLTAKQQADFLDNLDTLLSLRLNIDDHNKIPLHFRDYSIGDGRVTFKVSGEFEVDLSITDDDFTKQYWFVDFRFLFRPSPEDWSSAVMDFIEARVNEALLKDGLGGCYRTLHEMVLTCKVNEYRRQAVELQKQKWVGTLGVESLNRAAGIQYWVGRHRTGPKSWILLGVAGNMKQETVPVAARSPVTCNSTSSVMVRWFREGVEVKDTAFTLNPAKVSADALLCAVIGKHIEHILLTIHEKLMAKPRFAARHTGLSLSISQDYPSKSSLTMDLDGEAKLMVRIDPITGHFALSPQTRISCGWEQRLNMSQRDAKEDVVSCLEAIRTHHFVEEVKRRGISTGWNTVPSPVKQDDIKLVLNTRETAQYFWFRRDGWEPRWFVMLSLSLSGDKWHMVEL